MNFWLAFACQVEENDIGDNVTWVSDSGDDGTVDLSSQRKGPASQQQITCGPAVNFLKGLNIGCASH